MAVTCCVQNNLVLITIRRRYGERSLGSGDVACGAGPAIGPRFERLPLGRFSPFPALELEKPNTVYRHNLVFDGQSKRTLTMIGHFARVRPLR